MTFVSNPESTNLYNLPFVSVHKQFASAARRNPHAIALIQEDRSFTYAELLQRSLHFAAVCTRAGVTRGSLVGVDASRNLETVVALLGILFAGGVYVPIDSCDSASAALLARHKIRFFAGGSLSDNFPADIKLLSLAGEPGKRPMQFLDLPGENCSLNDPAYVLFTSGSTGARKGVIIPHRGILRLVNHQDFVIMNEQERTLLHSPLTFDASTFELWSALLHGGTVVLAPRRSLSVEDFRTFVIQHKITTLWLTSGLFHLIARHAMETFAPLRHLIAGGDVLQAGVFAKVKQRFPQLHLINGYGPTENTTFTTCYVAPDGFNASKVPIGEPLAGTHVYILDETGVPVPDGTPGELAAGGAGVALGYLDDPVLTSRRFMQDIAHMGGETLMYLTGDLVRRVDNHLDFLGRKDSEVKLAGQRVQLDEVEQAIVTSGLVSACSVLVIDGDLQDKLLVAFVIWQGVEAEGTLRASLKELLPAVAVPRIFRSLKVLPLTENGKIDRALLKKEFKHGVASSNRAAEPQRAGNSRQEWVEKVADAWKHILHQQSIDTKRNFFDLGGDSLSLMVLQAELQKLSPEAPSIVELFSLPNVESIADFLCAKTLIRQTDIQQSTSPAMAIHVLYDHAGEQA